jgi:hypothetical protein
MLILSFLLVGRSAGAKNNGSANKSKAPTPELTFESSTRLRGSSASLGRDRNRGFSAPVRAAHEAKSEARVAKARRVETVPTKKPAKPRNAYQQAFESLRLYAAKVAPTAGGRAEVSFIVGKKGEPRQASVFGLSPELDKALREHLTTLRFPPAHSGQFYTSKLSIVAVAKPNVVKPKSSVKNRRSRRGRAARRK